MSEERIKERCKREDIAFKVVQGFLEKDCDENTELYYSLQTILEKYKQEKEKNKIYEKLHLTEYKLEPDGNLLSKTIDLDNYISKDIIKEKIEKLRKQHKNIFDSQMLYKELLEEGDK